MGRKKIVLTVMAFLIIGAAAATVIVRALKSESYMIDILNADDYDKIEIWQNNSCASTTERDQIEEFIEMIQSKKLKRRSEIEEKVGYVFNVNFYKDGKVVGGLVIGGAANISVYDESSDDVKVEYYDFDVPSPDKEYKEFFTFYNKFIDNVN